MLLWIVVYCGFMVVVSMVTTTRVEPLDIRLISPIFVPFMYLFLRLLERLYALVDSRKILTVVWKRALTVGMVLWLIYPVSMSAHQISRWRTNGVCPYRTDRWMNSEVLHWVAAHPPSVPVFSDHPEAFYVRQGREFALSPLQGESKAATVKRFGGSKSATLIWFDDMTWGRNLRLIDDLKRDFELIPIIQLSDGVIYSMTPRQQNP
jgi:hypothetical protein